MRTKSLQFEELVYGFLHVIWEAHPSDSSFQKNYSSNGQKYKTVLYKGKNNKMGK